MKSKYASYTLHKICGLTFDIFNLMQQLEGGADYQTEQENWN